MIRKYYLSNDSEVALVNKYIRKHHVRLLEEQYITSRVGEIVLEGTDRQLTKMGRRLRNLKPPKTKR